MFALHQPPVLGSPLLFPAQFSRFPSIFHIARDEGGTLEMALLEFNGYFSTYKYFEVHSIFFMMLMSWVMCGFTYFFLFCFLNLYGLFERVCGEIPSLAATIILGQPRSLSFPF